MFLQRSLLTQQLIISDSHHLPAATTRRESSSLQPFQTITALLTISIWSMGIGIAPGIAQERKPARTLTASGKATVSISTTLTQVRLAVEVSGKTPTSTQQDAANRSARLIAYLQTQRVQKLQTTGIALNPVYNYPPNGGKPQLGGYNATNSISFRVATPRAGTILDAAVRNGASRIDGIEFSADDRAIETARLQALTPATRDAQTQADAVLASLNFKRKEVTNIRIDGATNPNPIPMQNRAALAQTADAKLSTPILGGEQQVEATVTLDVSY